MRHYMLAGAAFAALASSPAIAAADGPYIGIEGGVSFPQSTDYDLRVENGTSAVDYDNAYRVRSKTGYDVDIIAGFKTGIFRIEGEAAYKRSSLKDLRVSGPLLDDIGDIVGGPVTDDDFDVDGKVGVASAMVNGLLDFGGPGLGAYVGGGAGRARVSYDGDKDSAWAYQGIAGVRTAVSPNVDLGLKYRYFRTGKLSFQDDFAIDGELFETEARGRYSSHSLLASLIYNFNSNAPAPVAVPASVSVPAPVAPPATQTCPDGSVILATDVCTAPPPPPPAPPPPLSSGERWK